MAGRTSKKKDRDNPDKSNKKSPYRVLLIEDEEGHADLIRNSFSKYSATFDLTVSTTLQDAQRQVALEPFDLIIADWLLPDGKGIDIQPADKDAITIPVIIMTSHGNEELAVETLKAGAVDYIVKSEAAFKDLPQIAERAIREWENIIERKRAEKALRESEETFKALAENANDGILVAVANGVHTYANRRACEITGYSSAELLKTGIKDLAAPDEVKKLIEKFRKRLSGEDIPHQYETLIIRKDGKSVPIELTAAKTVWQGQPADLVIIRDISERTEAEKQIKDSETRFKDLFNNIGAGVAVYEAVGNGDDFIFRDINNAAEMIENVRREDVIGHSVLEIFPVVKEFGLFDVFRRVWRTGIPEQHPISQYRDNRISGWRDNYVYKLPSGEIVAVYEDVTEQMRMEETLREREKKYRALFENSGTGIVIIDWEGTYLLVNNRAADLMGATPDAIIGKTMFDFLPEDKAKRYLAQNRETMNSGVGREYEDTFELKTGKRSFYIIDQCLKDSVGRSIALQSSSVDITERKQAEEALRVVQEKYSKAFLLAPDAITISELDSGRFIEVNEAATAIFGYSREELIRKSALELGIWQKKGDRDAFVDRIREYGRVHQYEITERRKSGELFNARVNADTLLIGGMKCLIAIIRDITEQKQAETELKEANERFNIVAQATNDTVWDWNLVTDAFWWNDGIHTIFGYQTDEIEPTVESWYNRLHPEYRERVITSIHNVINSRKKFWSSEYLFRKADSSYAYIFDRGFVIHDYSGNAVRMVGAMLDITNRKQAEDALKKSQFQLAEAMDLAHIANWEFDVATGIFTFDDRFFTLYGTTAEREGGNTIPADVYAREFVHPDDQNVVSDEVNKALHATDPDYVSEVEHRIIRRDGDVRHIIVRIGITKDDQGRTIKTHGVNQDITNRKQMEEALRDSENKFASAFRSSPSALTLVSARDGRFVDVNEVFVTNTGYARSEIIGKTSGELGIFADKSAHEQMVSTLKKQGHVTGLEINFSTRTGEIRTCLISTSLIITGGHPLFLSTIEDITVRKQAEEALRMSEERLQLTMDATNDGLWDWDLPSGKAIFSPRWYTMLGYQPGEMPENYMTFAALVHPDDIGPSEAKIHDHIQRRDEGYAIELRMRTKTGDWKWILTRGKVVLRDADGKAVRMVGTHTDITDRKMMEDEIRSLNTALEQRIEQRTAQLTTSLEDKEVLLREVHHRVKNNLQIIISLLNLQSRYITDEMTLAAIRESQNRVRAMALVHEKLYQSADIARINLDDYVRFLGNSLFQFYGMKGKGIVFTLRIQDINIGINTAIPIGLIVNELVSNSLKHAFPDGRRGEISLAITRENAMLNLVYKDDGTGIPAGLDWHNAKSLGLRLVISLVEQLQGTIELDRTAGTAFKIVVKEKE